LHHQLNEGTGGYGVPVDVGTLFQELTFWLFSESMWSYLLWRSSTRTWT